MWCLWCVLKWCNTITHWRFAVGNPCVYICIPLHVLGLCHHCYLIWVCRPLLADNHKLWNSLKPLPLPVMLCHTCPSYNLGTSWIIKICFTRSLALCLSDTHSHTQTLSPSRAFTLRCFQAPLAFFEVIHTVLRIMARLLSIMSRPKQIKVNYGWKKQPVNDTSALLSPRKSLFSHMSDTITLEMGSVEERVRESGNRRTTDFKGPMICSFSGSNF